MARRSNLPLALGILALIVGAAMVLLVLRNDDDTSTTSRGRTGGAQVTVYVATKALAAGTSGNDLIANKAVEAQQIPASERLADAITAQAQLEGLILSADVPTGTQLKTSHFRSTTVRTEAITIPNGMQAVAIRVPFLPGAAGYVGPEDRINIYGIIKGSTLPQNVKLVLSNVQVIDVSTEVAPRRTSADPAATRAEGPSLTYLLALNAVDAAKVIYLSEYESIYVTLVPKDQPASSTPPIVVGDLLK